MEQSRNDDWRGVADAFPARESLGAQQRHCEKHGEYASEGTKFWRIKFWTPCPACEQERQDEEAQKAQQERAQRERQAWEERMHMACIPRRFAGKGFDNFDAPEPAMRKAVDVVRAYAADFERHYRDGSGLILMGTPGTGKSHLAAAVLQSIMPRHIGLYATCADVIREVRSTWGGKGQRSEMDVMRDFAAVPLLVLDEVGVQNGTDNEQHIIFGVLDARYRDLMPTIILTNQDADGLKSYLGERSYDRLRETSKAVQFKWESYRKGVSA